MAHEIAAALITGTCGIVAGAAPSIVKNILDRRRQYPSTRAQAIPGKWSGHGRDTYVELDKPFFGFDLTLLFQARGRKIQGKGDLSWENGSRGATLEAVAAHKRSEIEMECEGGFLTEDHMQFIYRSRDRSRKQLGVIVFRLSDEGDTLIGHYAGLSPMREVFVSGKVTLAKIASSDGRPFLKKGDDRDCVG
jgi:hypothetical protein